MTEREEIMKEFGLRELNDDQLIRCLANQLRACVGVLKDLDKALIDAAEAKENFERMEGRRNIALVRAQEQAEGYT
jgi:hypothetical protein